MTWFHENECEFDLDLVLVCVETSASASVSYCTNAWYGYPVQKKLCDVSDQRKTRYENLPQNRVGIEQNTLTLNARQRCRIRTGVHSNREVAKISIIRPPLGPCQHFFTSFFGQNFLVPSLELNDPYTIHTHTHLHTHSAQRNLNWIFTKGISPEY